MITNRTIALCSKALSIAKTQIGTHEKPGRETAQRIREYLQTVDLPQTLREEDETPWCAAFVSWCLRQAGTQGTQSALAKSYLAWGQSIQQPIPGCVVVLKRGRAWQGHVGFWIEYCPPRTGNGWEDFLLIGGNQGDSVSVIRALRAQVIAYRAPPE